MRHKNLFMLDADDAARACGQFGLLNPVQSTGHRNNNLILACILVLFLIGIMGVAVAQTPGAPSSEATPNKSRTWLGTMTENGQTLMFRLQYEHNKPVIHISGHHYHCFLNGTPHRLANESVEADTFNITTTGGRCDQLLGGTMTLAVPENMSPHELTLKTYARRNHVLKHHLVLTEQFPDPSPHQSEAR